MSDPRVVVRSEGKVEIVSLPAGVELEVLQPGGKTTKSERSRELTVEWLKDQCQAGKDFVRQGAAAEGLIQVPEMVSFLERAEWVLQQIADGRTIAE